MEELDNDLKIKHSENDYAIKIDSFQDINSNTSENNRLKKKTINKSINYLSNKKKYIKIMIIYLEIILSI